MKFLDNINLSKKIKENLSLWQIFFIFVPDFNLVIMIKYYSFLLKVFLYSILPFLYVACKDNPKPLAKAPKTDLKKTKLEGAIKTQNFINYSYIKDSVTNKWSKTETSEVSIVFNKYGFELEEFFRDDSKEEHSFYDYDSNFRRISENHIFIDKKNKKIERIFDYIIYDSLGYETERYSYNYQDTAITAKKYISEYDKNGQKTSEIEYLFKEKSWQPVFKLSYDYDDNGNQIEKRISKYYLLLWITKNKESYTYEDKLLKEANFSEEKDSLSVKKIIYDYKGREQIHTCINNDGKILYSTQYVYDNRENITKITMFDTQNREGDKHFYTYTPQNKMMQHTMYKEGKEYQRIFYEYNTKGNITKESTYENNELKRFTEIKYTYY